MTFRKGQSGNPGGRPKALVKVLKAARMEGLKSIKTLVEMRDDAENDPRARIAAANALLDRGFGKPVQSLEVNDGRAPITAELGDAELTAIAARGSAGTAGKKERTPTLQ